MNARILVVEDSATQAEALRSLLADAGYDARVARSVEEALEQLPALAPDLVLSDVLMPGADGYELCRRIKADPATRALPVVLLTGLADPRNVIRGLEAGADNYVMKPYAGPDLLERVGRVLAAGARRRAAPPQGKVAVTFMGERYTISADAPRILDVLLSSFEELVLAHSAQRAAEAERRKLERALETSEARFRGLASSNVIGVSAANSERVLDANDAYLDLLGYTRDDIEQGRVRWREMTPPEYKELDDYAIAELRRTGTCVPYEKEYLRSDGTRVPVMVGAAVVSSSPEEWVTFVLDMSARRRTEEKLQHAQRMQAVGKLAGGVAHEVNNMMTAVIGFGELTLRALGPGHSQRRDVEEMVKAANRAAGVTRQLLAFSRQQVLRPSVLEANSVVVEAQSLLQRLLGAGTELVLRLAADAGRVRVDRGQLEQVLVNLAVNARDAMQGGGRLTISTSNVELDESYVRSHPGVWIRPGPYVMIAIEDSGVGMDAETLARAFEPFFTTKPVGQGTGLGLSTVYGIVKQSDGYVWVYSEPNLGTTVKVYLPRVQSEAAAPPAGADLRPAGGDETVLIVEDEEVVRSLASRALGDAGYRVFEAADAREALALMGRRGAEIDLVLSDVVMPGMNGRELGRALAADHSDLPVLFMSGYTGDEVITRGLLDPDARFLPKPFTPLQLAAEVRRLLDERRERSPGVGGER